MGGLSSDVNQQGDSFSATLEQPIVVDGWVVARRGQIAVGQVVSVQKAGRVKGVSFLGVALSDMPVVDGRELPVASQLVQTSAGPSKGRDAAGSGHHNWPRGGHRRGSGWRSRRGHRCRCGSCRRRCRRAAHSRQAYCDASRNAADVPLAGTSYDQHPAEREGVPASESAGLCQRRTAAPVSSAGTSAILLLQAPRIPTRTHTLTPIPTLCGGAVLGRMSTRRCRSITAGDMAGGPAALALSRPERPSCRR